MDDHEVTWRERLIKAQSTGITLEMLHLADEWSTCAVGEQWKLHPQVVVLCNPSQTPMDHKLRQLGSLFSRQLHDNNFLYEAEQTLDQIEDRVLELKRRSEEVDESR